MQGSLVPSVSAALPPGFWDSLKIAVGEATKQNPLTVLWSVMVFGLALFSLALGAYNYRANARERNQNNWKALDQDASIKAKNLEIRILKQQLANAKGKTGKGGRS